MQMKIVPMFAVSSPLLQHRENITSQYGEDGIIAHIVKKIEPEHKYCIEFGASDGTTHSNTNNLVQNHGWSGLMLEANKDRFVKLVETFSSNKNVTLINRFVDFEGDNKLDNILKEQSAPKSPALVSIDIDGNDYYVWESLTEYTPEVIVIEFNPTVPNDVVFVQEKSFDVNHGCSLLALVMLGKAKGYELAVCTTINAFFVRNDKFGRLGIGNNFISNLYTPVQNGRIFQGYDGTIHVVGFDKLMWIDNRRLTSDDFQILPEKQRGWSNPIRRTEN